MEIDGGDIELLEVPHADQAVALEAFVSNARASVGGGGGGIHRVIIDVRSHGRGSRQVVLIISGRFAKVGERTDALQAEATHFKGAAGGEVSAISAVGRESRRSI